MFAVDSASVISGGDPCRLSPSDASSDCRGQKTLSSLALSIPSSPSSSVAAHSQASYQSRDPVGHRKAAPFPLFLQDPVPAPPGTLFKESSQKSSLAFPLSPQSPGKGGWPLPPRKLTDPSWGGSGPRAVGSRYTSQIVFNSTPEEQTIICRKSIS